MFLTAFVRSVSVSIFTRIKPLCYDFLYGGPRGSAAQLHPFVMNFPVCFLAGACAGVGTSILSCPFEFIKVYSQIALLAHKGPEAPSASALQAKPPALPKMSTVNTIRTICRHNGVMGLYSGFRYQVVRDATGSGVYFAVYESFKWATNYLINGNPSTSSPISILIAGGTSGITCWAIIFPLDTAKSLIQRDIVTNTLRAEQGLQPNPVEKRKLSISKRMYRGLGISMGRSFLVNMVFFGTYEFAMKHFV